jgi:hypothetical protein
MKLSLIIWLAAAAAFAASPGDDLITASRRGQIDEVKKLLDAGAPIEAKNQYGATPLYMAVFNGHADTVQLLLARGADPNVTDTFYKASVLSSSLQKGNTAIARLLLAKGAKPEPRHLLLAAAGDDAELLKALIASKPAKADLTAARKSALAAGKADNAKLLLDAGADDVKLVNVPAALLTSYAGEYTSKELPLVITLTTDGAKLTAQATGQPAFPLAAESETEFNFAQAGIKIVFEKSGGFALHQMGRTFAYTKKDSAK